MTEVETGTVKPRDPPVPVCAIGASAGGVRALQRFFEQIDDTLGLAYVVIVHLSPDHESQLSEILAGRTAMPVLQVEDSPRLEANRVYVIAPDRELAIEGNEIRSRPFTEPRGQRAPIDMFFRSIAAGRGDGMAVVLSGAGSDGAVGVTRIKEAGGVIFVQDPAEAEFAMMPRSAIATGVADFVEPIDTLVERIAEVSRSKAALRRMDETEAEEDLRRIMNFLRGRTGHDFSSYKRATVMRRVGRRMQVTRSESLASYARFLHDNPEEAQDLFADLLISVTAFFRDAGAFEALAEAAVSTMVDRMEGQEKVRVWCVGCATGEEAFSLAILILEEAERRRVMPSVQIFASDLDDGALATAREGRYPKAIEADVSEERLQRFFVEEGSHYRVRKEVRDLVLFAHHSAVKDPLFMRLDLVTCRNLLIYLERDLQRQLLALFHYALNPGGTLFLGSAESVDTRPELFAPIDREARVYVAKPRPHRTAEFLTELPREHRPHLPNARRVRPDPQAKVGPAAHATALEGHAPPSALVDEEQRVLNLSKGAGRFLRPPEGPLSQVLSDLVRPELRTELRRALQRAFAAREPTFTLPAVVALEGVSRRVVMHVSPVIKEQQVAPQALVLFMDAGPALGADLVDDETIAPSSSHVRGLEEELRVTHERLSASRHDHEAAIQELRVANEELQSTNEEYRSTAEELETSKEELQSINEEISTVNDELKRKLEAIASAHSDLQNLVNATEIGTLFLDSKLRIKMMTPAVVQLFSVTDSDVGRPITDFTHKLAYDGVERDAARVLRELAPFETEVSTQDGRWLMMRLRPYRTVEDRIEGVVLSFVDISARRQAEERLQESEARYRTLFEAMDEGYLLTEAVQDAEGRAQDLVCRDANPAADRMIRGPLEGRSLKGIGLGPDLEPWDAAARVLATGKPERLDLRGPSLDQWLDMAFTRLDDDRVAILFTDVTMRKRQETERELLVGELNHRVKNMLAVVLSVARQTMRTTDDVGAFTEAFASRIQALGRAHGLLTRGNWQGTQLKELAHAVLDGFAPDGDGRLRLEGPDLHLAPSASISLAMVLHELGTNAIKYGAFASPEGVVSLGWELQPAAKDPEGGARVQLEWKEMDGPPVVPPTRKGFGRRMIEEGVAHELHGEVEMSYEPNGLRCRMTFAADRTLRHGAR